MEPSLISLIPALGSSAAAVYVTHRFLKYLEDRDAKLSASLDRLSEAIKGRKT